MVEENIPVSLLVEGAASHMIESSQKTKNPIKWIIVGSDRIASNGDVANKIGTFGLAILAKYHGIKFMVVAPTTTIDMNIASGADIPIEQRDSQEVLSCSQSIVAASGAMAVNPAFDVTPAKLVDAIVTEKGVVLKNNKNKQSIEQFLLLFKSEPTNHYYINGLAQALLSSEKKEDNQYGLNLLKKALQESPLDKVLSANFASALIQMDKPKESIQFINSYNQHNLKQAIFYQLLSRAYGKQGDQLKAHTAQAEYYYLSGRYKQAMTQIKIAKKLAKNDFYTLSRLESKLLEIEEEKKKYQLEPDKSDSKKRKK